MRRKTKMSKWVPLPGTGKGEGGRKEKSKPAEYDKKEWLPVRRSQIKFYTDVPLYKNVDKFVVYKHPGEMLDDKQIAGLESTDQVLYIKKEDKITAIREVHQKFNQDLEEKIQSEDLVGVKSTLMNIVEETLAEPLNPDKLLIPI